MAKVIVLVTLSSLTLSLTPVTVTVCAVLQFEMLKVSTKAERETSVPSPAVSEKTTLPVGSLPSTTLKVSVPPLSLTRVALSVSAMVKVAASTPSVVVTLTL